MAKVYKVINDPLQPATEASDTSCLQVDWNKCILCQTDTSEILSCPADSKRITKGAGYKTVAENLQAFEKIGSLPKAIYLCRLNEGEGIEASFQQHKAKWHDSCRLKFNKTKLQRAEKRKAAPDNSSSSKSPRKYTRRSLESYQTLFINASSVVSKLKVKTPCTEHRHLSLMPEFVTALYSYRTNLY